LAFTGLSRAGDAGDMGCATGRHPVVLNSPCGLPATTLLY